MPATVRDEADDTVPVGCEGVESCMM
jgi:hypothetical protein